MAEGSQEALHVCLAKGSRGRSREQGELRVRPGVCRGGPLSFCSYRRPDKLRQAQFNFCVYPGATGEL